MAKAQTKRIMHDFRLDEISAVTVPAQKGARMVIMKRDDGEEVAKLMSDDEVAAIVKRGKYLLTTENEGHSHLVEVDDWAKLAGGGYTTPYCVASLISGGRDVYHSHPFVIGPKGEITIGKAQGHDHGIADVPTSKAADIQPAPDPATEKKDDDAMTAEEIAKLQADIAKGNLIAGMTDAQKTHYAKLSGDAADAFLKMDFNARNVAIAQDLAKGADADPVVYTTAGGIEIRKSAGDAVVAALKIADQALAKVGEITKSSQDDEAERLAKSWTHIGKPHAEKLEMAKRIVAIPDPLVKAAAIDGIRAGAVALAPLFKFHGANDGGVTDNDGPLAKLDRLTADRVAKVGNETPEQAYAKVLETAEGAMLYKQARASGAPMH